MKSRIRIATAFVLAGAALGYLTSVVAPKIGGAEVRLSDGTGPVYPPGRVGAQFSIEADGTGPVYPPGSFRSSLRLTADGTGPVYPPGGRSSSLAAIPGKDGGWTDYPPGKKG